MTHKRKNMVAYIAIKIIYCRTMHSRRRFCFGERVIVDGGCVDFFLDFLEVVRDIAYPDIGVGIEVEGGIVGAGGEDPAGCGPATLGVVAGSHVNASPMLITKAAGPVHVAEAL